MERVVGEVDVLAPAVGMPTEVAVRIVQQGILPVDGIQRSRQPPHRVVGVLIGGWKSSSRGKPGLLRDNATLSQLKDAPIGITRARFPSCVVQMPFDRTLQRCSSLR